jgi:phosphoribosylformylglycinamidine cyclo-ligase
MPPEPGSLDYPQAGVDIDAGDALVAAIGKSVAATHGPEVLRGLGHFGGFFRIGPVGSGATLVASADGVGTKLKVAVLAGRHHGIGADIVNHCVNDILACGASPLFFLDYFATGSLDPEIGATVINSIAETCKELGVALLGGETAEMPGIYQTGDYDLAGFIVGMVAEDEIVDGSAIQQDDLIFGLPSDGFHTNGYSLVRAALGLNGDVETARERLGSDVAYAAGLTLAEALLQPHRCYLQDVRTLLQLGVMRGMAHVTGGGIPGNVSRVVPEGLTAAIDAGSWSPPPIFEYVTERGHINPEEAFRVFNMGIGFVFVCDPAHARVVRNAAPDAVEIGSVQAGSNGKRVQLLGL